MTISEKELAKIAHLAYLDNDSTDPATLQKEISSIMDFADQLRAIDTSHVAPLFHPFAVHQRLRADAVTESECIAELEAMATLFEDNLYLVPQVLEPGK